MHLEVVSGNDEVTFIPVNIRVAKIGRSIPASSAGSDIAKSNISEMISSYSHQWKTYPGG